ncbi:hypothetical protein PENSPDRAFT_612594 [Peniophora sp. CONT]|nr:hypothetical protein PENSPDRAFT_612594 [Peniophora sp. CONT]
MVRAPLILLTVAALATACPEDDHAHDHVHMHKRAFPQAPLTPPSRPLTWGDVNIIHTTDSHGWLLGHQKASFPEPNYSGDFGDFASFVTHMKALAKEKDVDLLLVDSGDLHDGTGLSDGYPAGGVDGHESNKFFSMLPYDVAAIGNHELYNYSYTFDMYKNTVPKFHGRYLSSNVNITVNNVSVPVGERFAKFKTAKGRKVTALGVLFDFTGNGAGTTVQKVEAMVNETWFHEAIAEEPDFFLLAGHMPVANDKWPLVFDAVRAVHPTTPILILGGHTHIRDCNQPDGRSMALESGRYMETVGWMSVKLDKKHSQSAKNLTFTRRYLDPNRVTYEYHTRTSNHSFDTQLGSSITKGLNKLSKTFDLSALFGTAPRDYTLSRDPYPSNGSILSLVADDVLPVALSVNNTRADIPKIVFLNSGSFRFDIFAGPFDKNDQLTASPFTDSFLYLPNVTASAAQQVIDILNGQGEPDKKRRRALVEREEELYSRGVVAQRYNAWLQAMSERETIERRDAENLTLGYVTTDSCPGVGDDTPHIALPFFSSPDYVASPTPDGIDVDAPIIDFVIDDFIVDDTVKILNEVQTDVVYSVEQAAPYSPLLLSEVLGVYAQVAWN